MSEFVMPRRQLIARAGSLAAALPLLSACDAINDAPAVRKILSMGEEMNRASHRALIDRDALARELADMRSMPQRTQITRHDCVEGWSAIGQWTGVQLSRILTAAGVKDSARYIVFRCADRIGDALYYESCDMVDARHPQTIMAWALNDAVVPIANGAPLRLRIERQLGYKHAKYVTGIEAVASLDGIGAGKGGYWEDRIDYEWYAGI